MWVVLSEPNGQERSMNCRRYLATFCFVVFAAASTFAQFSGNVQGTVVDPSGAAVVGAQVDITNVDTGVSSRQVSDSTGDFRFSSLAPGQYRVTVTAPNFATQVIPFQLTP